MAEHRVAPEILELVRRTSAVRGCDSVFSLAPRGHRVGFYFQQRRATLLAKALQDRLGADKLKSAKIAVVGAGVTGVSFFLSLLHYGAKNAFLYEASDGFLKTGSTAVHRLIHPNYNRWPMLGSMDIFTSLPVLNWCADTAKGVAEQLQSSIKANYSEKITNRFKPHYRCVTITQRGRELTNSVKVQFECNGMKKEDDFEIVVLSVGFGDEACKAWGLEDYWTAERVPFDADRHRRAARVFGTGDGALIDILRCCAKTPDKAWEIPLGLIGGLRDEAASVLQQDIQRANLEPRTLPFSDWEVEIQQHEESIRSASWHMVKKSDATVTDLYVEQEGSFYRNLVGRLQINEPGICAFLESRLKPIAEAAFKPKLVGAIAAPFEPTSAPINKLLVAYLLVTGRIVYEFKKRGETEALLSQIKTADRDAAAATIEICRYGTSRNFPSSGTAGGKNAVSVAVESNGTRTESEETNLEGELIELLSGLSGGEYVYFDAMPHPLEVAQNGHHKGQMTQSTRKRFMPTVVDFARRVLEGDVTLKDTPPRWVVHTALKPERIKEVLRLLGGIDGVFCGAPIVVTHKVTQETAPGEGFQ
jgi:hypothetical protein